MYQIVKGVPIPEKGSGMSAVKYTNTNLLATANDVRTGKQQLVIPENGGPDSLNDINIAAYTILDVGVMEMPPKDVKFVAHLTDTQSVTKAQRSRLASLFKLHVKREIAA